MTLSHHQQRDTHSYSSWTSSVHPLEIACTVLSLLLRGALKPPSYVDVAAVDLQVTAIPCHACVVASAGWSTLQLGLTSPSLTSEALRSFVDEEVKQCFVLCSALEAPNDAWCQAQLRFKHGGLGLCSRLMLQWPSSLWSLGSVDIISGSILRSLSPMPFQLTLFWPFPLLKSFH